MYSPSLMLSARSQTWQAGGLSNWTLSAVLLAGQANMVRMKGKWKEKNLIAPLPVDSSSSLVRKTIGWCSTKAGEVKPTDLKEARQERQW